MSVTKADVETVLQLISQKDVLTLKAEEFDIFQYQGFDPLQIAAELFKVKRDKSISEDEFIKDVCTMTAIGMIKGSVNDNNINKMSEDGKKGVLDLNKKYGIKLGGGRGQGAKVITYPRVMATFPDLAVRMTKVLGGKPFRGGPLMSVRLPDFMQIQVFPSIIPRHLNDKVKKFLLTAALCYSIDQTVQISQIQQPDLKQLTSVQGNYVNIGHNSPVPVSNVRVATIQSLTIPAEYDNIKAVVEEFRAKVDSSIEIPSREEVTSALNSI
jgi:hypothetical protein